jgi:hypothetical protein
LGNKIGAARDLVERARELTTRAAAEAAALAEAERLVAEDDSRLEAEAHEAAFQKARAQYERVAQDFDRHREEGLDLLAGYAEHVRQAQPLLNELGALEQQMVAILGQLGVTDHGSRLPEKPWTFQQQIYHERTAEGEKAFRFRGMAV